MKQEAVSATGRRAFKAVVIILAILTAVSVIDVVTDAFDPPGKASAVGGLDADALIGDGDAEASLERIEEAAAAGDMDVPEAFADEVGFLPDARDMRVSGGGDVVGYVVPGDSGEVLAQISERMGAAGWTEVPLGEVEGATFVKSSGACTWALVTCTQVGNDTSVVARCVIA